MSKQDRVILQAIVAELKAIHELLAQREERSKNPRGHIMGRPTKGHIVRMCRMQHPDARKMEVKRGTGLSIKTVSKYWDINLYAGEEAPVKEA